MVQQYKDIFNKIGISLEKEDHEELKDILHLALVMCVLSNYQ